MINIKQFILLLMVFTVAACQGPKEQQQTISDGSAASLALAGAPSYQIGDQVPHDLVCMVNNAYMGKKQFEVPFEGKTYYGCCNMCVERIPVDKDARTAVDPYSSKSIDKSEAYIVLVGGQGQVAYFENEENYKNFLTQQ
jgi:YHS domain-containing protein